jgi:hypothetical protein
MRCQSLEKGPSIHFYTIWQDLGQKWNTCELNSIPDLIESSSGLWH